MLFLFFPLACNFKMAIAKGLTTVSYFFMHKIQFMDINSNKD